MAISPSQAWLDAMTSANVEVCFLIDIYDGTTNWKATSAVSRNAGVKAYPTAVANVASVSAEIDPLTREPSTGQSSVIVQDAWIRPIAVANRLRGKQITIKIGTTDLAEGVFLDYFVGNIGSVRPIGDGQWVELECLDIFDALQVKDIVGYWLNQHPLEVIEDILSKAEVPTSLIDTSSLDPSTAAYAPISRFVVQRIDLSFWSRGTVNKPTKAFELVKELGQLLNGSLIANESGKVAFKFFDSTVAAVDHWTSDDFIGPPSQVEVDSNIINRVAAAWIFSDADGEWHLHYQQNDTASQTGYAFPGETERILSHVLESRWLPEGGMFLPDGGVNASATSWLVKGVPAIVAGANQAHPSASQPAWAKVSSTYPGYWRIEDEIVKVTAIAFDDTYQATKYTTDPLTGNQVGIPNLPFLPTATVVRGQLGTTAVAHTGTTPESRAIHDLTLPWYYSDTILRRFKDGVPILEVSTSLAKYQYQVGDLVTLDWPQFLAFGLDGITSSTKWEIVAKEPEPYGNPPRIRWRLAKATTAAPTDTHQMRNAELYYQDMIVNGASDQDTATNHSSGLLVTKTSGFNYSISVGYARTGAARTDLRVVHTGTVLANKDTYVTIDVGTKAIAAHPVATGAAPPDFRPTEALLAKVISDGTQITSIDTTGKQEEAISPRQTNAREAFGGSNYIRNSTFDIASRG